MNKNVKVCLECLAILVIAFVISLTSIFNPWFENAMSQVQEQILEIAHQVRDGYLTYVEIDAEYGPVLYEFYGLGYLLTETHIVHFIMEMVLVFFSTLFLYKSAKLYTSHIFALISTVIVTVFGWGSLSSCGAEVMLFFIFSLTAYHVSRQLKYGFLSYHTYLLAIDLGVVFFIQPGYSILWAIIILFFAVKFKVDGLGGKEYRGYYMSVLEGLITVSIPMALYLWYFRNGSAFLEQVVAFNFREMGNIGRGLGIVLGTGWSILFVILLVVIVVKILTGEEYVSLCCWLGLMIVTAVVLALQVDCNMHSVELLKAFGIVPLASAFSLVDKHLGLKVEERKY